MTLTTTSLDKSRWGLELPEKSNRVKFAYSTNMAPSYVPKIWIPDLNQPLDSSRKLKVLESETLIEDFKEDIRNHAENRIQLFFQQLLLFYKTGLCFEKYFNADAQVGDIKGNGAAAHSGTLPTLRIKSDKHSGSISVGHGTSFYYNWNTTVYLPTPVNHFDSAIDSHRGSRSTLRESALEILNEVSINTLDPKEGLRGFLSAMITRAQEGSRAYPAIAKIYEQVASAYLDNLDNGYPLIQKFCLRPMTEKIDETFYLDVQNSMLEQMIKKEVSPLIAPTPAPEINLQMRWRSLRGVVAEGLGRTSGSSSETARTYVRACAKESEGKIKSAAIEYLNYLYPFTERKQEDLLKFLSNPKELLSSQGSALRTAVLEFINTTYKTKSPQNIPFILGSVFYEINEEVFNSSSASPGTIARDSAASDKVHTLLQEKIISLGETDTKKITQHIATCISSEKVKRVAIRLFDSLLSMPEFIQRQTLLELVSSKTSGSRELVLEFRSEGKEALGKAQKIPYILLRTLQEVNKP